VNSLGIPSSSPLTRLYKLKAEYAHLKAVHPDKFLHKNKQRLKERFETINERAVDRHDISIEVSKDLHSQEHHPPLPAGYGLPQNNPSYHAKMPPKLAAVRLEFGEVEPGLDGIKALRVTVIYPAASELPLPTEMSDLGREAVWEAFFRQMSIYHRATRASAAIITNQPRTETREDRINASGGLKLVYREQELTLSLLERLHKLYDLFEIDKHTTTNRGLGHYSRVSKRPYDLDGGDWTPYFDPKDFKHILVGWLFDGLYNFLAQLHNFQRGLKKGEIWSGKPIDAHWVSKMMLDACRAWDDLCWFEDCFSPRDVFMGNPYCLRPTINHPEALSSAAGVPGTWIRRLSESAPAYDCPLAPPVVHTAYTEGPGGREPLATESVLQYPAIAIPKLADPLSKVELQISTNRENQKTTCTTDLGFKGGPETLTNGNANENHEIESCSSLVKGKEKVTEDPAPKPFSVSGVEGEQSVKWQNPTWAVMDIAERLPRPVPELSAGNSNPHMRPRNLNEKTQPKQGTESISEDSEAQNLVAKGIIADDKAKMGAIEASFKWARLANKKLKDLKSDPNSSAHDHYLGSAMSTIGLTGAAYSATPSSSAGEPDSDAPQVVSTYGPFESAGYAKLPSPCGSFENESYITRLCHNEDNAVHVDEKLSKPKFLPKIFKKGEAK